MSSKRYAVLFEGSDGIQWETIIYAKNIKRAMKQAVFEYSQYREAGKVIVELADIRTGEDELERLISQLDDEGHVLS